MTYEQLAILLFVITGVASAAAVLSELNHRRRGRGDKR